MWLREPRAVSARSIAGLWISLVVFYGVPTPPKFNLSILQFILSFFSADFKLLNELTVHVALASRRDVDVMCDSEDWPNFANERRISSHLLDECASSQFKPGKSGFVPVLLFLIHLAMASECKYTAWFSRMVIVLQFVFILCSKLRWFPASKWVKFVPKSWWIDSPTVRQRQKLIENKDSAFLPMKEWN